MLIVQPQGQALKVFKHFSIALQEENPRVMTIVINDEKNDGNKSLYLIFVGVVFLSILDCF
jgi:hypothetical protein